MRNFILAVCACSSVALTSAQSLAPSPEVSSSPAPSNSIPATSADVEALPQEGQSLTQTLKGLQQQVKDQQTVIDKAHLAAETPPENPEPTTAKASSSAPDVNAAPFPTEDSSVVASAPARSANGVDENGTPAGGSFQKN